MIRRLGLLLLAFWLGIGAAFAEPSTILRNEQATSPALGHPLRFALYLPPGYSRLAGPLPVVYLLHGAGGGALDWVDEGHVQAITDKLIREHRIGPTILAMPDAGNSWYVDSASVGGPGDMATAIARDLPAWIESHWKARRDGNGRAVTGYSMGGFGALRLAFTQPRHYAAAAAMSGAFWTDMTPETKFDEKIQHIFQGAFGRPFDAGRFVAASPMTLAASVRQPPPIFLICGTGDRYRLDKEQADMEKILADHGIPVQSRLIPGDHDWDTWSAALPDVLAFLDRHMAAPVN